MAKSLSHLLMSVNDTLVMKFVTSYLYLLTLLMKMKLSQKNSEYTVLYRPKISDNYICCIIKCTTEYFIHGCRHNEP